MKSLFVFSAILAFLAAGCAASVPMSDGTIVASEISVANGRNPVLFAGRSPDDGQWILLTDERAAQEIVVYASFQDLLTLDSTLAQVKTNGPWRVSKTEKDPFRGHPARLLAMS